MICLITWRFKIKPNVTSWQKIQPNEKKQSNCNCREYPLKGALFQLVTFIFQITTL